MPRTMVNHEEESRGGVTLSWPMVGVMVALIVSTVTGAIKLGGVQTQVEINTGRISLLETADRRGVATVSRIDADLKSSTHRLDAIEQTRPTTGELLGVTKSTDARIEGLEYRLRALEAAPRAPAIAPAK